MLCSRRTWNLCRFPVGEWRPRGNVQSPLALFSPLPSIISLEHSSLPAISMYLFTSYSSSTPLGCECLEVRDLVCQTHCVTLPSMRKNAWLSSVSLCHHVSVRFCIYSSISAPVSTFTLSGEMHTHKVLCTILGCSHHPRPMKDPATNLGSHILFKEFEFSHLSMASPSVTRERVFLWVSHSFCQWGKGKRVSNVLSSSLYLQWRM